MLLLTLIAFHYASFLSPLFFSFALFAISRRFFAIRRLTMLTPAIAAAMLLLIAQRCCFMRHMFRCR